MVLTKTDAELRTVHYFVLSWADKGVVDDLLQWLIGSHIADVVAQPGFEHGQLMRVDSKSADGRVGVLTMYRVRSMSALETYFASEAKVRFDSEGARFAGKVRIERWWGAPVFAVGAAAPPC